MTLLLHLCTLLSTVIIIMPRKAIRKRDYMFLYSAHLIPACARAKSVCFSTLQTSFAEYNSLSEKSEVLKRARCLLSLAGHVTEVFYLKLKNKTNQNDSSYFQSSNKKA